MTRRTAAERKRDAEIEAEVAAMMAASAVDTYRFYRQSPHWSLDAAAWSAVRSLARRGDTVIGAALRALTEHVDADNRAERAQLRAEIKFGELARQDREQASALAADPEAVIAAAVARGIGACRVSPVVRTTEDRVTGQAWWFEPKWFGPIIPGPWDSEPDKLQWVDPATNLDCLALRNHSGAWCGYVGVPQGHPSYGVDYAAVPADVHGDLTFASLCDPGEPVDGICHIAHPGREPKPWWLGFDCGHYMDLVPAMDAILPRSAARFGTYRTVDYVRAECTRLAEQLAAVTA